MSESQTPRTDAAICRGDDTQGTFEYVEPSFARELESELTAARARLAELEGIADKLYKTAKELSKVSSLLPREKAHLKAYEAYKEGKK